LARISRLTPALAIALLPTVLALSPSSAALVAPPFLHPALAPINPIAGDASFVAAFGRSPSAADDEDVRIATHLASVIDQLAIADLSTLPPAQQATRRKLLDDLREYREHGEFPRNHDRAERAPCFIDRDGRICAVGYLIEQSAGRAVAETINARYQYAALPEIAGEARVRAWIAQSGFTVRELAMIQPFYEPMLECLRFTGHSYSNGASLPESIWLVAKVDPESPMFLAHGLEGELTLVIGPILHTSYSWFELSGKLEVWADAKANSLYLPDPPNPLVPACFSDGTVFASLKADLGSAIEIHPPNATGPGSFNGWITFFDSEVAPFAHPTIWLNGTLKQSTVAGYDLDWEGTLLAGCDLAPVEASTWGQIKSQYR
jgi:hypothetical protein